MGPWHWHKVDSWGFGFYKRYCRHRHGPPPELDPMQNGPCVRMVLWVVPYWVDF